MVPLKQWNKPHPTIIMRKLYILCAILMLAQSAFAQVKETSSWRFGFTGGVHASELRISDLNKDLYPTHKALFSGIPVYFQNLSVLNSTSLSARRSLISAAEAASKILCAIEWDTIRTKT